MAELPPNGVPDGEAWRELWQGAMNASLSGVNIPGPEQLASEEMLTPLELAETQSRALSADFVSRLEVLKAEPFTFHEYSTGDDGWTRVGFLKKPYGITRNMKRILVMRNYGTTLDPNGDYKSIEVSDYLVDPKLRRIGITTRAHYQYLGLSPGPYANDFPDTLDENPDTQRLQLRVSKGYHITPPARLPLPFLKDARLHALGAYNAEMRELLTIMGPLSEQTKRN